MDAPLKMARQRWAVLQPADVRGHVSDACRRRSKTRTPFDRDKRLVPTHRLAGLTDVPPMSSRHPLTAPPEVGERVVAPAGEPPLFGCDRPDALLLTERRPVPWEPSGCECVTRED